MMLNGKVEGRNTAATSTGMGCLQNGTYVRYTELTALRFVHIM
jgi:hypothetical protein